MKKLLASVLMGTLLFLPAPAFAAPDNRINVNTLTFDKIEQYMNTYNSQISANNEAVADIKVPDSDDKAALQGMLTTVNNQITNYDTQLAVLDDAPTDNKYLIDIYTNLKVISLSNQASLQAQINSFDENQDKASDARTNAALQTEAGNKQIIWGAEQLFLGYNSLTYQIKQQTNQLELLYKQLNIMKLRQQLGLVSNTTYKSLEKSVKELEIAVKAMNDQKAYMKEQLNTMFNQNYNVTMEIAGTPDLDQDLIQEMDLEEDYKLAEPYSFNARAKDDSWEREAEERKFHLAFKEGYQNVIDKQQSLELEQYKLENQKELFDQAQVRFKVGLISKVTLDEQRIIYDNQFLKVQIAEDDLFKAYRQYEWMKKGLSL